MSDLRESGAIEQDADIVCFIHRPEYYLRSDTDGSGRDIRGLAEFIVAKHRSGRVDDVELRFKAKYARFENWDGGTDMTSAPQTIGSGLNNPDLASSFGGAEPLGGGSADFLAPVSDGEQAPF